MDPNISSSLMSMLNQSTPYAPSDADEAAKRMDAAAPAPVTPAGNAAPPETLRPDEAGRTGLSSVFVPTARPVGPGESPEYELRVLEDGTAGIAVYTSVDRLRANLGVDQPWAEASLLELLYLVGKKRIGVALNPHMDPDILPGRRAHPEDGS